MHDLPVKPSSAPAGWHPADIVAAVRKTGTNLRRLALSNGFGESTLRAALLKPHPRANHLIAVTIGRSVHELWPLWFDARGDRKSIRNRAPSPRHASNRPAARARNRAA